MPLTLKTRHSGSVSIIECAGSIIYGEEERALDAALDHAEHGSSRIVLDLSGVVRLDSMGLGQLVRHQVRLAKRGGAIHLAGSPAFVLELLDVTKCFIVLPSFATEEEAIASFVKRPAVQMSERRGSRLLVFDPSPDLCTFARTILSQHGFDVRTSCAFGDAKLLLRVHGVDYVLVGPCNTQLLAADAARDFAEIAPRASVLRLSSDFKSHDALAATEQLLQLFGLSGESRLPS